MIRRPPRSTLFPTRRSSDLGSPRPKSLRRQSASSLASRSCARGPRSEEHTSELQSLTNLVCRLLLEKKNKHIKKSLQRHIADTIDTDTRLLYLATQNATSSR